MARRHSVRGGKGQFVPKTTFESGVRGSGNFFDTLTPGIGIYAASIKPRVAAECRAWAKDAVEHMQANAPWNDRTGMARASLNYAIDEGSVEVSVHLTHGVYYGVYLELHFNEQYAIIAPTIQELGPDLMRRLEAIL